MSELLTDSSFWILALIVSAAMVVVFYQDIKTYLVDKEMVAWKRSKGYLTDEQATTELHKARKSFIRNMIFGVVFYYVSFFAILLGIGLIAIFLYLAAGYFSFRRFRWCRRHF